LCPDFVLELRLPSDRVTEVQDKMVEYLASGVRLGWLIEPIERHEAPAEISGGAGAVGFDVADGRRLALII
jgi:Uma2 family endonuclease